MQETLTKDFAKNINVSMGIHASIMFNEMLKNKANVALRVKCIE